MVTDNSLDADYHGCRSFRNEMGTSIMSICCTACTRASWIHLFEATVLLKAVGMTSTQATDIIHSRVLSSTKWYHKHNGLSYGCRVCIGTDSLSNIAICYATVWATGAVFYVVGPHQLRELLGMEWRWKVSNTVLMSHYMACCRGWDASISLWSMWQSLIVYCENFIGQ